MGKNKSLLDRPLRSTFVESAARLARIARPGEQNGEGLAPLQAAADRMSAVSPDESWAKRFMSMGIGPRAERSSVLANPPIPRPKPAPKEQAAPAPQASRRLAKPEKPMPMGAQIGKPVRRSWFGRLILGH